LASRKKTAPAPSPAEEWRPIPGLAHYEASSLGRIRSLDRTLEFEGRWGVTRRRHRGRVLRLKTKPNGWGGFYQCFYAEGGKYWQSNRTVCAAFHGQPPSPIHEAAHLDGNSLNDQPSNLKWATPAENASHKAAHGTAPVGTQNGMSRLTDGAVICIFERYVAGEKTADLAASFGVSTTQILSIVRGDSWASVPTEHRAMAKARAKINHAAAIAVGNARRKAQAEERRRHV
jgi:hypothetical protein